MRVVHVLSGLHVAGIEQLALQLISHTPPFITSSLLNLDASIQEFREALIKSSPSNNLRIDDWRSRNGLALSIRSFRFCRRQRPDAVMIYPCNIRSLWFALGARMAGVRAIGVHYANPPLTNLQHLKWLLVLAGFAGLGARILPCSATLLQQSGPIIRSLPIQAPIPNGLDTSAIKARADLARSKRSGDEPFTVLMTARLDAIKDHRTLICAYADFQRRVHHTRTRLWLAGDGNLRISLEALAQQVGLDPSRIFLGNRDDIPDLLGQADLFAYSTTAAEGAPFALIEALAAGLPVMASHVAACPEILANGEAGLLLPLGNVAAWSSALHALWSNPEQRHQLSKLALQRSSHFDINRTAKTIYDQLTLKS